MSGPFSPVTAAGKPSWDTVIPGAGNFMPIDIPSGSVLEVGFGEGGFGEDGFDTPTTNPSGAATPDWQTVSGQ